MMALYYSCSRCFMKGPHPLFAFFSGSLEKHCSATLGPSGEGISRGCPRQQSVHIISAYLWRPQSNFQMLMKLQDLTRIESALSLSTTAPSLALSLRDKSLQRCSSCAHPGLQSRRCICVYTCKLVWLN